MSKLRAIKIYWNQGADHFFLCHAQLFPYFLQDFSKKNIFHGPTFIVWLRLRLEILCNVCIVIICFPVCDVINFKNKVSFLIKPLPYITKIVRTSFSILRMKIAFKMKWNHFENAFMQANKTNFCERRTPTSRLLMFIVTFHVFITRR